MRRFLLALALIVVACGGGESQRAPQQQQDGDGIDLLFMGNSHSSVNDIQGMVVAAMGAALPGKSVTATAAPGWMFLDERYHDQPSIDLLRNRDWSFVILQAQKYSTSGQFEYSTAEAEALIRMARGQHATPILFPEWPRRGVDETMRIYDLHVSIAQREPACVAPIGQAFDLALQRDPSLALHADDGNHSSPAGAFLAALILSATMTGASPLDAPFLAQFPVDEATQAELRTAAADTVNAWPPRRWCPDDAPPDQDGAAIVTSSSRAAPRSDP